ncbi:MAG: hypothetical protein ABGX27_04155 [Desulfurobacteriaceae bacterium]
MKTFILRSISGFIFYNGFLVAIFLYIYKCLLFVGGLGNKTQIFDLLKHSGCVHALILLILLFLVTYLLDIILILYSIKLKEPFLALFIGTVSLYLSSFILRADKDWILFIIIYALFFIFLKHNKNYAKVDRPFLVNAIIFSSINAVINLIATTSVNPTYLKFLLPAEYVLTEIFTFFLIFHSVSKSPKNT